MCVNKLISNHTEVEEASLETVKVVKEGDRTRVEEKRLHQLTLYLY